MQVYSFTVFGVIEIIKNHFPHPETVKSLFGLFLIIFLWLLFCPSSTPGKRVNLRKSQCPECDSHSHKGLCMGTMAHPDWLALFASICIDPSPCSCDKSLLAALRTDRSWHTSAERAQLHHPSGDRVCCGVTKGWLRETVKIHCKNSTCALGIMFPLFPVLTGGCVPTGNSAQSSWYWSKQLGRSVVTVLCKSSHSKVLSPRAEVGGIVSRQDGFIDREFFT